MLVLMWIAAVVAATIHVLIFCMESLWWDRPAVRMRFRLTDAQADASRLFALNQGFYNLFLALGVAAGLALMLRGSAAIGLALVGWNCLSMVAAAVVLVVSAPRMRTAALIQGGAPLVYLAAAVLR
jgi:putative membrane protein